MVAWVEILSAGLLNVSFEALQARAVQHLLYVAAVNALRDGVSESYGTLTLPSSGATLRMRIGEVPSATSIQKIPNRTLDANRRVLVHICR